MAGLQMVVRMVVPRVWEVRARRLDIRPPRRRSNNLGTTMWGADYSLLSNCSSSVDPLSAPTEVSPPDISCITRSK